MATIDKRNEELVLDDSVKVNKRGEAILGVLEGPCADVINPTRNDRQYDEALWNNVFKDPIINEYFECGGILGELDHPADRTETDTSKVAICMPEKPKKGKDGKLYAKFDILEPLKLADLRNPRQSISPFTLKDEDELNQIYLDLDYLCHLGEELSKPILPREAHLEYLSSQYLCELIKHCGFDGVVYKSSVGDGDNFAIFYDEKLKASEVECYQVNNVNFDFDII